MDIIFFAAVAVFIFFKLRGQFGKVDEDQKREAIKKFLKEQTDIASLQTNQNLQDEELEGKKLQATTSDNDEILNNRDSKILNDLTPLVQKRVNNIIEKSKISISDFINGANTAFEMIINAFSNGDKDTLKSLLSKELLTKFESAIHNRIKNKTTLKTNIVSINSSTIKDAKLQKNEAIIIVNFISKQIIYTLDENGDILEGSKDYINEVSDIWTFSRDIESKNPNWTIVSTKS